MMIVNTLTQQKPKRIHVICKNDFRVTALVRMKCIVRREAISCAF